MVPHASCTKWRILSVPFFIHSFQHVPLAPPPPHPKVRRVCGDPGVDGVLVQLPLPRHCDEGSVMEQLDPSKDVDGFHPLNMG